jgi:trehalose 6-phosphate phosphatase
MNSTIEEFLVRVGKAPLSALLLDYDGTLAPFSEDRERAVPYPGVVEILQEIISHGRTRVVMVSGREAHEVGPLLKLEPYPEVWGVHGLQRLRPDGTCQMPTIPAEIAQILEDARRWLSYQGLLAQAEIKPGSIAIHWRALSENAAAELRAKILLGWSRIADGTGLELLDFDGGVELRLAGLNKSDAVRTIREEVGSDVPMAYLGDDTTDERAFRALDGSGLAVLVRTRPRRTAAQAWLRPPDELLQFLTCWSQATATSQSYAAGAGGTTRRQHA